MELDLAASGLGKYSFSLLSVFLVGCPSPPHQELPWKVCTATAECWLCFARGQLHPSVMGETPSIPSLGSELLRSHLPNALGMHGRKARSHG